MGLVLGWLSKESEARREEEVCIANMSGSETLGHDLLVGDTMNPMIKVEG